MHGAGLTSVHHLQFIFRALPHWPVEFTPECCAPDKAPVTMRRHDNQNFSAVQAAEKSTKDIVFQRTFSLGLAVCSVRPEPTLSFEKGNV
jgi:NADH:ubiquinone oxidoreductase subunit B-like Fe-S oxidoreductase